MKKYLSLIFAFIISFNLFAFTAFATNNDSSDYESQDYISIISEEDVVDEESNVEDEIANDTANLDKNTSKEDDSDESAVDNSSEENKAFKEIRFKSKKKLSSDIVTFELIQKNSPEDKSYKVELLKNEDFSSIIKIPEGEYSVANLTCSDEKYEVGLLFKSVKIDETTKTVRLSISETKVVRSFADVILDNLIYIVLLVVLFVVLIGYRKSRGEELLPELSMLMEKIKDRNTK